MRRVFRPWGAMVPAVLLAVIPASRAMAAPAELASAKNNPSFVTAAAIVMGLCALTALGAHIWSLWKKD